MQEHIYKAVMDGFRNWFILLYSLGLLSFAFMGMRYFLQRHKIEKKTGPLPTPGILVPLGLPLIIMLTRFGEITAGLLWLRWTGAVFSLGFIIMLPWVVQTLGRFALPGQGVFEDHELIITGPFRFVRHPLYSAANFLWLGAGLGTLNWLLLVLWLPIVLSMILFPVRIEERLMREKFGAAYEDYMRRTGRLLPRFMKRHD